MYIVYIKADIEPNVRKNSKQIAMMNGAKPVRFVRRREPFSIRRFTNQKNNRTNVLPNTRGNSRTNEMSRASRSHRAPFASERRPRASERRRPTSLLHSLFDFDRKNEEVRFRDRFRVRIHPTSFRAHHGSIPIHSFIHSDRVSSGYGPAVRIASRGGTVGRRHTVWDV